MTQTPSRIRFQNSLIFRTICFNLVGLLLSVVLISFALDHYTKNALMDRLDHELETEILVLTSEFGLSTQPVSAQSLARQFNGFALAHGIAGSFFRAVDGEGRETASSDLRHWPGLARHPIPLDALQTMPFYWETGTIGAKTARIIYYRMPEGLILQVGYDLSDLQQQLRQSRWVFGAGMAGVLFFSTLGVWIATRFSLKGIRQVTRGAVLISSEGKLDHRVPLPTGSSETDALAMTFNQMLAYIQRLLGNLQEIMENVAHDLKSPVTRLRINAESRLVDGDDAVAQLAGDVVEECDRILQLINSLLELTDVESGLMQWQIERLNLSALLAEGMELFDPLAEVKEIQTKLDLEPEVWIASDAKAVQRVVANLLDNAVKFTPEQGLVQLSLHRDGAWAVVSVADSGIGIAPEAREKIFDRFYREDRSRGLPGSGLGLSFCRAAVTSLGGEIRCESTPGEGSQFIVKLPLIDTEVSTR